MRKSAFCICKNKRRSAVPLPAPLFSLHRWYNPSSSKILNFKRLTIFGCTAQFVSDLVGSPEDRFSRDAAHVTDVVIIMCTYF